MGFELQWVRKGDGVAFHPKGELLAVVGVEIKGVELLDRSGRMFERLAGDRSYQSVVWSPSGDWLVLVGETTIDVLRIEPEERTSLPRLGSGMDTVTAAFADGDKTLFIKPSSKKLQEYRLPSIELVARHLDLEECRGGALVGIHGDRVVMQQATFDRRTQEVLLHPEAFDPLGVAPDGRILYTSPSGLWLLEPGEPPPDDGEEHPWYSDAVLSADGSHAVALEGDALVLHRLSGRRPEQVGRTQLFDLASSLVSSPAEPEPLEAFSVVMGMMGQLALLTCRPREPFAPVLAKPGASNTQVLGKLSLTSDVKLANGASTAAFSPDGEQIAVLLDAEIDPALAILDLSGKELRRFPLPADRGVPEHTMRWSGGWVVLESGYTDVWLVDPASGEVRVLSGMRQAMYGSDGRLYALKDEGALRALDPETGQTLQRLGDLETFEPAAFTAHPRFPFAVSLPDHGTSAGLEVHDLERGESWILDHEVPELLRWLPSAPVLVMISGAWVTLYDLAAQRALTQITLPENYGQPCHAAIDASESALVMATTYDGSRMDLIRVGWADGAASVTSPQGTSEIRVLLSHPTRPDCVLIGRRKGGTLALATVKHSGSASRPRSRRR